MDDFYPLGINCVNCGKPLKARASKVRSSISIRGLRDLDYRHEDGTIQCIIRKSPQPFDGWKASKAFDEARRRAWDIEDQSIESNTPPTPIDVKG